MGKQETIICHIDVNSAFLSWTAAYRVKILGEQTDLRTIPSAICGDTESRHGIILAKSAPACAFGIKTGEPLYQAKRKCPQLLVVPPDYALYVQASRKFIALLKQIAPVVEQYSIDEAYCDLSGTEQIYGTPVLAAERIKNSIRDQLGFTVNVGIAHNKLLAKMASDFEKPDKVHTLFPQEIEHKLWPLPVRDLFMVGPATEKKLKDMGIFTIGQLAQADPKRLRARLHKHGETIWHFANGRCDDRVTDSPLLNKSYGNSLTTPQDIRDTQTAHKILLSLSETVGMRMRQDKQVGSCVSVSIRSNEFHNLSRQKQLLQATDSTMEIYHTACQIFDNMWDKKTPLRLLGIYMSKMDTCMARQGSLFIQDSYDKQSQTDKAVDIIRKRFGEKAILRACFLQGDGIAPLTGGLSKERRKGITRPLEEDEDRHKQAGMPII